MSQKFNELLAVADDIAHRAELAHFWFAYKRGLQSGFYGQPTVGEDEHQAWLALATSKDTHQLQRHRGYSEGYAAGLSLAREKA
jgi:hypothetical protein